MALHVLGVVARGGARYALLAYPVLPWIGVMLLGYGMGHGVPAAGASRATASW